MAMNKTCNCVTEDGEKTASTWVEISPFQTKMAQQAKLPLWATVLECPTCKKPVGETGVRSITWRLNAKNFGDVVVEGMCQDRGCNSVFEYCYRKACRTAIGFHFLSLQDKVYPEGPEVGHPFLEPIVPVLLPTIPRTTNNLMEYAIEEGTLKKELTAVHQNN